MFHLENPTGRLITLRTVAPVALADLAPFVLRFSALLGAQPGKVVACVDLRRSPVLSAELSTRFLTLLRQDNPKAERSGFLLSAEEATLGMQVARMLREAGNPGRQAFTIEGEMERWLGEVLTQGERGCLREFLAKA